MPSQEKQSFWNKNWNKKTLRKNLKRLVFFLGLGVMVLFFIYIDLVKYGLQQGQGQLRILWEAQPNSVFLEDPDFPDSLKQKIQLISEIKQFSVDSLGLNPSGSYEKLFDQKNKPILWIVTACPPYTLEAHRWTFPILGRFSYKGFFEYDEATKEKQQLDKQGLDTKIGEVSAWSTLGYLNDPILSSMFKRPVGRLANLILHELTHGTLFVKNNITYNENLANFIGDKGAIQFLKSKYGANSAELREYEAQKIDRDTFTNFVLRGAQSLDSLYGTFSEAMPIDLKEKHKKQHLQKIINSLDSCNFINPNYCYYFSDFEPNNTFFAGYARYNARRNYFEEEFQTKFQGDFPKYLAYLKEKYAKSGIMIF